MQIKTTTTFRFGIPASCRIERQGRHFTLPVKAIGRAMLLFFLASLFAHADSDWVAGAGDWNTASNWIGGVPNGPGTVANFDFEAEPQATLSANTEVGEIGFEARNITATVTVPSNLTLTISGQGIVEDTGPNSIYATTTSALAPATIVFTNSAVAGEFTYYNISGGSVLKFENSSSADLAYVLTTGQTIFQNTSTAANSILENGTGGKLTFENTSTASASTIDNDAASGEVTFQDSSTAGTSTIQNGSSGSGFSTLNFTGSASAGHGVITNEAAGFIAFADSATAGSGQFTNGEADEILFGNSSTAAQGTFENQSGGLIFFQDSSTAGSGTFTNDAAGIIIFNETSAVGAATSSITNDGAAVANGTGGETIFSGSSSAETSSLTADGGIVSSAGGGLIEFAGTSTAAAATLTADGGTSGGSGGKIDFENTASGSTATITVKGNGELNIAAHTGGVEVGSLNGNGYAYLGANQLTVGNGNASSVFSGSLQNGPSGTGGSFYKEGTGRVILAGANTYTGSTTISAGVLQVDGSITSDPTVQAGATLGGSGTVGNILMLSGGFLAPGDVATDTPGILTAASLFWEGGAQLNFDLGNVSDYLALTGSLDTGYTDSGTHAFDFLNQGVTVGDKINLIGFGSEDIPIADFTSAAGDGVEGTFAYKNKVLQFTVTATPEPSAWVLLLLGMLGMVVVGRRSLLVN